MPERKPLARLSCLGAVLLTGFSAVRLPRAWGVEIPLDTIAPVRIGYIDLQKVFDTYPEKSFAEGDLLKEIEKRKRELGRRQNLISTLRQQIASDEGALAQAKTGQPVVVPVNTVPAPEPVAPPAPPPVVSSPTVTSSSPTAAAVEPYPTEDPLMGLPGHEGGPAAGLPAASTELPGMETQAPKQTILDLLAASTGPVLLNADAISLLKKRIDDNHKALDKSVLEFKNFRTNALGDMKTLQTQKTYGVMSKIYAELQVLARDEGITVVLDKAYVLYGEDTVDLSDKLISRLNANEQ